MRLYILSYIIVYSCILLYTLVYSYINELKKIIDDLNEHVSLIGGDIGKLEKNTIIVTSHGIKIWRSNNINKFL